MEITITRHFRGEELPWIVLIHGFGGSKHMWKKQVEAYTDFNLLIPELPGHGDSQEGISQENMQLSDVAVEMVEVLHQQGIYKAHFICVSLGTLVVSAVMEYCPEIVDSVIFCGAVLGMSGLNKLTLRLGNKLRYFLPYMAMVRLLATVLMPRHDHKVSRKFLIDECRKLGRAEFSKWYGLLNRELYRLRDGLSRFDGVRSLMVMGSQDHVFLKNAKTAVRELHDNLKLKIIGQCGHVCSLQKWREFNSIALGFLRTPAAHSTK